MRSGRALLLAMLGLLPFDAHAQDTHRVLQVEMVPVRRAQFVVWIERADGTYLQSLGMTQSVAVRGLGNRPGASQMNSGFQWPYGRREGVLPVWAHHRASAPGAEAFRRVIFQDRQSEGWASRSSNDFSRDAYYCLSFNQQASSRDNLDAVSCPSVFSSDKGRYLTEDDAAAGYAEPFQTAPDAGNMRALSLTSLYPPRRDVTRCGGAGTSCYDHPDVDLYALDVRRIMPELDAITMATPPEGSLTTVSFTVPDGWPEGDYVVFIEVNTEGDYNEFWGPALYPTPVTPSNTWDSWAITYGYAFRGQPSVVYRLPVRLTAASDTATTTEPSGYGSLDGLTDALNAMDETITIDPTNSRGSGGDRLLLQAAGWRARVTVIGPELCEENVPPSMIPVFELSEFPDRMHAHRYAQLSFDAATDDAGIARYEVRVGTEPIVDEASYMRALPANAATLEHEALVVPTTSVPGERIEVDMGGLNPETHYYVAVRAYDQCNVPGPFAAAEFTTLGIEFTTVSPCFVATAAYGTPMADEIRLLRRFRDRHLRSNAPGRAFVSAYETFGPYAADVIREDEALRSVARTLLGPIVSIAAFFD